MSEQPTPERMAKGDIRSEAKWLNHRQHVVLSAVEAPLHLDALHRKGILSDRLYSAGETLRGLWRAIGHGALTFNYQEKTASPRELSNRQADFWKLYNDCCRNIPIQHRITVIAVCCDDEVRDINSLRAGLHSLDGYLARLHRDRDGGLSLYFEYLQKGA